MAKTKELSKDTRDKIYTSTRLERDTGKLPSSLEKKGLLLEQSVENGRS